MGVSDTLAASWVPALVDAALKGSVVLIGAAAIDALWLRRRSASARHFAWTLALSAVLLQAPIAALVPAWHVPLPSPWTVAPDASTAWLVRTPDVSNDPDVPVIADAPSATAGAGTVDSGQARRTRRAPAPAATAASAPESLWTGVRALSWPAAIFWIWVAGAVLLLVRLVASHARVAWLVRRSHPAPAPVRELGYALAHAVGAPPAALRLTATAMPSACGVWRRSVLLPVDAMSWSFDRLRLVLLHELAHVRRRDCLVQAVAELACAVYWFNPLVWIGARRLQQERERACDDCVLAAGARGTDYAEHLIDIARMLRSSRMPLLVRSSVAMAHQSQLEGRLVAILDPAMPRARTGVPFAACACALTVLFAVPLAALRPEADPVVPVPPAQHSIRIVRHATMAVAAAAPAIGRPVTAGARAHAAAPAAGGVRHGGAVVTAADPAVTLDATRAVAAVVSAAVAQTVQAMQADSGPSTDPHVIAALTAAMKDTDADVRRTAMAALMRVHSPEVYDALAAAVHDTDADVRQQAVFALGQLHDRRATKLLAGAASDSVADVREQAVFALGQLRDPDAHDALAAALRDPKPDVRRQAAFALGQVRDVRAVDALVAAVRDDDAEVRQQAVFALGQLRDQRGTAALVPALKDSDHDVRQQAAFALGQLRDPAAVEALIGTVGDAAPDVRGQALFALGQIRDPRAIDAVTAALKDADADVRRQAAFALSQLVH